LDNCIDQDDSINKDSLKLNTQNEDAEGKIEEDRIIIDLLDDSEDTIPPKKPQKSKDSENMCGKDSPTQQVQPLSKILDDNYDTDPAILIPTLLFKTLKYRINQKSNQLQIPHKHKLFQLWKTHLVRIFPRTKKE